MLHPICEEVALKGSAGSPRAVARPGCKGHAAQRSSAGNREQSSPAVNAFRAKQFGLRTSSDSILVCQSRDVGSRPRSRLVRPQAQSCCACPFTLFTLVLSRLCLSNHVRGLIRFAGDAVLFFDVCSRNASVFALDERHVGSLAFRAKRANQGSDPPQSGPSSTRHLRESPKRSSQDGSAGRTSVARKSFRLERLS
jgi:hypothetical protein